MKKNLYLIEFYVKDPATGEGGYDINFAWVYARSKDSALLQLILNQTDRFDETIQVTEHSEIAPLTGDLIEGENLFIIGSPDEEMTDEEFVEDMRTYRLDHLPDGWPAVQTWKIDRLIEIIDKQRVQLSPKWTKELPTEPGWYWYRPPKNGNIKMGIVFREDFHGPLSFSYESKNGKISEFIPGEWCGPLIPPAVPEVN